MRSFLVVICLLVSSLVLLAQGDRGTITGTVSDPAGALVASAAIQAKNVDTGAIYPTESTATGNYTLSQLPAGTYELTATVAGFKKYVRQNIQVQVAAVIHRRRRPRSRVGIGIDHGYRSRSAPQDRKRRIEPQRHRRPSRFAPGSFHRRVRGQLRHPQPASRGEPAPWHICSAEFERPHQRRTRQHRVLSAGRPGRVQRPGACHAGSGPTQRRRHPGSHHPDLQLRSRLRPGRRRFLQLHDAFREQFTARQRLRLFRE